MMVNRNQCCHVASLSCLFCCYSCKFYWLLVQSFIVGESAMCPKNEQICINGDVRSSTCTQKVWFTV